MSIARDFLPSKAYEHVNSCDEEKISISRKRHGPLSQSRARKSNPEAKWIFPSEKIHRLKSSKKICKIIYNHFVSLIIILLLVHKFINDIQIKVTNNHLKLLIRTHFFLNFISKFFKPCYVINCLIITIQELYSSIKKKENLDLVVIVIGADNPLLVRVL